MSSFNFWVSKLSGSLGAISKEIIIKFMVEKTKAKAALEQLPPGFQLESGIAYGYRVDGLLEIKFHAQNLNVLTKEGQTVLAKLFTNVNKDEKAKCVLLHGGKYYGAGNDLSVLMTLIKPGETEKNGRNAVFGSMVPFLTAIKNCEKPIVAVVRGGCHGIHFTPLTLCDFVYCGSDAMFSVPFVKSFQSPEGLSTVNFAK
jgi:enoyl-CoA hydratase/carnithine racemase